MNEKDKEECMKKIEEWEKKRRETFCPLTNENCRLNCECLNRMRFDEFYGVQGGYCTCYALVGGNN